MVVASGWSRVSGTLGRRILWAIAHGAAFGLARSIPAILGLTSVVKACAVVRVGYRPVPLGQLRRWMRITAEDPLTPSAVCLRRSMT